VLQDLAQQRVEIDKRQALVKQLVRGARNADASWADIGRALAVSPQAAHKRFRYRSTTADG
jgi:hypothetical protein